MRAAMASGVLPGAVGHGGLAGPAGGVRGPVLGEGALDVAVDEQVLGLAAAGHGQAPGRVEPGGARPRRGGRRRAAARPAAPGAPARSRVPVHDAVGDLEQRPHVGALARGLLDGGARRRDEAQGAPARDRAGPRARPCRSHRASTASGAPGAAATASRRPGSIWSARITGRVTVPSTRSVPRRLPVAAGLPARSRMSSKIWKAIPTFSPKAARRSVPSSPRPPISAPRRQATAKSAAVLRRQRSRYASSVRSRSKAARCWSISPWERSRAAAARALTAGAEPVRVSSPNARANRKSPVLTARSAPREAATVGRPRRMVAPSSRSSCTSVAMCTSSTAAAALQQVGARRRGHQGVGRGRAEHQQGTDALAAGRQRVGGGHAHLVRVAGHRLAQAFLAHGEERRHRLDPGGQRGGGGHAGRP